MGPREAVGMKFLLIAALLLVGLTASAQPLPTALNRVEPAQFQAIVERKAREMKVPGALVLLRTPQGEFVFATGTSELGQESIPSADMHYRIASNTKTMTAAVILLLAQEKKLALDDVISRYVDGVPKGGRITLAHLLSMRSGLFNYTDAPELARQLDEEPSKRWTPGEVLAMAFSRPLNFEPGAAYEYCNTNYALLGLVAEKIEGRSLAEIFQRRLFRPLGLSETQLPSDTELPTPYAHGYMYGGSAYALTDIPYSAEWRDGKLPPHDYTHLNPSYATAAGGALSTATDQADWIEAVVDGRVFNADTQSRWFSDMGPQNPAAPEGQLYGYGITRMRWAGNTVYFHGGEQPGYNSFIGRDPEHKVTLIVWTNLTLSLQDETTANALMLKILDRLYRVSPLGPVKE